MKRMLVFMVCFLVGFFAITVTYVVPVKKTVVIPKKVISTFSINTPPTESIQATIATVSGTVLWESRIATQASAIGAQKTLSQGESIQTGKDGLVSILFPSIGEIMLLPLTTLNIIQTIPSHMVFTQSGGTATYQTFTQQGFAVTAQDLLVEQANGKMTIVANDQTNKVYVHDILGSINIGYNDLSYNTQTDALTSNEELVFDDTKRTEEILPLQ